MTGREPRWHHFVPQFYLRRFSAPNKKIAVIDRSSGEVEIKSVRQIAAERDFYTLIDASGQLRFDVEYALGRSENDAAVSMNRAAKSWPPNTHDKRILAMFIALQYTRGQHVRDFMNEVTEVLLKLVVTLGPKDDESLRRRLQAAGVDETDENVEQLRWLIEHPTDYRVEGAKGQHIITSLEVADELAPALAVMDWHLVTVDPPVFLTSDSPVTLWRKPSDMDAFYGIGPMTADEIRLPIDPGRMILLTPPDQGLSLSKTLPASPWGWEINKLTVAWGHRRVYANPMNPQISQAAEYARGNPPKGWDFGGLARLVRETRPGEESGDESQRSE